MGIGIRNYQKRILIIRGSLLLCFFVAVALSISVYTRYTIERDMSSRREAAEKEEQMLNSREEDIRKKVEHLKKESSKEAEIRKNFDVAKEGEQVIILLDEANPTSTIEPIPPRIEIKEKSWYQFWR